MHREEKSRLTLSDIQVVAELAGKGVLAGAALFVVVGILVVSLHLSSFGVADSGLLRSHYVATGAVCVLLNAAGVALWFSIGFFGKHLTHEVKAKRYWGATPLLFLPVVFVTITAGLVAILRGDLTWLQYYTTWAVTVSVFVASFPVGIALFLANHFWIYEARKSDDGWRPFLVMEVLLLGVIGVGTALPIYTTYVYPNLDPGFGGGRPALAKLVLAPDAFSHQPETRHLLVQRECEVITESGEWIVIRLRFQAGDKRGQSIIKLKRDVVLAIVREQ